MGFIEELKWRGMLKDSIPGTEEFLSSNKVRGYVGFDPTAPSLGIGNLVPVMLLAFLQKHGHTPVALVGGATGMVGDPSGKSAERNLLDANTLQKNLEGQKKQLRRFLNFDSGENKAIMVNNYDWFKEMNVLDFLRDIGKHITVSYMMSKDSVQSRLEKGISYTEFTYQLIQGYDFVHLYKEYDCKLQLGGSDQWGNITTGTELISRMLGGKAFALTTPLLTKSDGTKYGKSEKGNLFLDAEMTSPFELYQYFINLPDEDIPRLVKTFSLKEREEIEDMLARHDKEKGSKTGQKGIAEEMLIRIHGQEEYDKAVAASQRLYQSGNIDLTEMSPEDVAQTFDGVPSGEIARGDLEEGIPILDFMTRSGATASNGEARRAILKDRSVSVNNEKIDRIDHVISLDDVINDHFILIQKSKKKRHIVYVK